jgi:hypothetical protein
VESFVASILSNLTGVVAPPMALGMVIATAYAVAFRAFLGGRSGKLLLLWIAALLGFWAGQSLPFTIAATGPRIGELRLVEASIGAFVLLLLARRLRAW